MLHMNEFERGNLESRRLAAATKRVEEALERLKRGELIILTDDESRENEGDLVMAAELVTAQAVNFMATHGRGLICVALCEEIVNQLDLPMMPTRNASPFDTAFTVSIEARRGVTTGISAEDRATTIRTAMDPAVKPDDLRSPGHVFPLRARRGGVLVRTGQTEGSVDLVQMAGLRGGAVICEVMNADGTMARRPELEEFGEKHDLLILSIADIVAYRMRRESFVKEVSSAQLPIDINGREELFTIKVFESTIDRSEHIVLVKGEIKPEEKTLVRVHSSCVTGDIFRSKRCDCGQQIWESLGIIVQEGRGVFLYMHQEGRGIGLANKIKSYALQDRGVDTVEANHRLGFSADLRDYGIGAQILVALGVRDMRLLTNNPSKVIGLEGYGLRIAERIPLQIRPNERNRKYLQTKRERMGHLLDIV